MCKWFPYIFKEDPSAVTPGHPLLQHFVLPVRIIEQMRTQIRQRVDTNSQQPNTTDNNDSTTQNNANE